MRERMRALGTAMLLALAAGLLLAGCAAGATTAHTTAPAATPVVVATSSTERQLAASAARAVGSQASKIEASYDTTQQTATVTITLVGKLPLTDAEVAAAHERTKVVSVKVAAALWVSGVTMRQLTLITMGPIQDEYADIITDWYGVAVVQQSSAQRIRWSSVSVDDAWNAFDQHILRISYDLFD